MAEVDVVTKEENEQKFANVFLFLITIQSLIPLEFGSDVGQFLVNALNFGLFALVGFQDQEDDFVDEDF
jgi:hypothetical protein